MKTAEEKTELRTVDDFIAFFSSIPDEKWWSGGGYFDSTNPECRCAIGHLGEPRPAGSGMPPNVKALYDLFTPLGVGPVHVSDGCCIGRFPQSRPKARILAALNEIKANQEK